MAGNSESNQKTVETVKKLRGADWYARIGAMGGRVKGIAKGFATDKKKASEAGKLGVQARRDKLDA